MNTKYGLGARIRAFRRACGMTQEQLAEAIERTPEAISNIERGQSLPSLDTLERLANSMNVSLSDFFADKDEGMSARRIEHEVRLRTIAKSLSDEDLEISVRQAEILLEIRSKGSNKIG